MAVRSNTDPSLDEERTETKEEDEWEDGNGASADEGNGADHQVRLDRHALVSHGKQIAALQDQMTEVMAEMGAVRRLCASTRDSTRKTNAMLETLGKHLGVQLNTGHLDDEKAAG